MNLKQILVSPVIICHTEVVGQLIWNAYKNYMVDGQIIIKQIYQNINNCRI